MNAEAAGRHVAAPTMPSAVLERWQHSSSQASSTTVLPDGCIDLLVQVDGKGSVRWSMSPLARQAYGVQSKAGTHWLGYRLHPGVVPQAQALLALATDIGLHAGLGRAPQDTLAVLAAIEPAVREAIDQHTNEDPRVRHALAALAAESSVARAARALGVTERSLERLMGRTGEPPRYWRALARVRRAAHALSTPAPLAAVAADHGFADQSHFSRECLRWLGHTPTQLRSTPALLAVLHASGYG